MEFLDKADVLRLHERTLREHGGVDGFNDESSLDSALMAPPQRRQHENADLPACAATYAYHLGQAGAFQDGNKRVAAAAAEVFVQLNGGRLTATNDEIFDWFLRIADSMVSREEVEHMFRQWVVIG
jgi:death-on-curing protein